MFPLKLGKMDLSPFFCNTRHLNTLWTENKGEKKKENKENGEIRKQIEKQITEKKNVETKPQNKYYNSKLFISGKDI